VNGPDGERLCGNCGEPNPVRAKFCLECGTQLNGAAVPASNDLVDQLPQEAGSAGERRLVTVVFADLSGFTAYSEGSDVEDVRAIAQETATQLGDIVERYGGTVDKIIGDCVMAVFGAPLAHEDDPERAVRAAIDMQECVAENQHRFGGMALSIGMQTGEAMWAPVGSDGRYTVLGDTVNTAARLQGAAGKGEIYIGQPTYHSVTDVIECEPLEPIKAKNKAEPVPAWKAVSVKGRRSAYKPVLARLAGRDAELKRLEEVWSLVTTNRRPYEVTVLGSAGVGKSRLVGALTDGVGDSALVLRGHCLPYGEGITYWPIIEMIRQVAEIHHDDHVGTISQKLDTLLEALGSDDLDELRTMAVALANLIGAPTTPRGTYSATQISRGELHWGLRRILELGSQQLPLVLVIEDLQYAESTLVDLIRFIFSSEASAPILGICTARPEFAEIGGELLEPGPNRRVIDLESLTDDAARRMVGELLGDVAEDTLDQILQSAGGNPLFIEEIAQVWREARAAGDDAAFSASSVPAGLQALIGSRLDGLSAAERRVVSSAAVVGDVFWPGMIAYLVGNGTDVESILDALEGHDLVRSHPSSAITGEREYGFKHGLIRDAAYKRLTKSERATLHERCGTWIGGLAASEHEFAEIVAYHLEQACRIAADLEFGDTIAPMIPASHALQRAAKKAESRGGIGEAERFLSRAIELLGDAFPETVVELKMSRGRALAGLARYDDAHPVLTDTAVRASELRLIDIASRAFKTLAEMEVHLGKASDAHAHIEEAERLARQSKDPVRRIETTFVRAMIQDRLDGQRAEVIDTLRGAIALAEEIEHAESIRDGRMRLGVLYFNSGDLEEAEVQFERAMELAKDQGSLRISSWLATYLGRVRYFRGPRSEADDLFAKAHEWMERTGDRYMQVATQLMRAQAALSSNDLRRAIVLLRTAHVLAEPFGGSLLVEVERYIAEALFRQGRTSEVGEVAAVATATASPEDSVAIANASVAAAFRAAAEGDQDAARRSFAQAMPHFETQGTFEDIGEARLTYARLLETFGDLTAATDQLERAREVYEKVGALAAVEYADTELARLRDLEVGTVTPLKREERSA
jgi:class 3 adenylate cyclase/predicted ATPase